MRRIALLALLYSAACVDQKAPQLPDDWCSSGSSSDGSECDGASSGSETSG